MAIYFKKIKISESKFKQIIKENLSNKIQSDDIFAQHLYASLCNTIWYNKETHDIYSCSWRYAGGFIAEIRNKNENYLDFYCSGGEGKYFSDVDIELNKLGYYRIKYFQHLQEYDFL